MAPITLYEPEPDVCPFEHSLFARQKSDQEYDKAVGSHLSLGKRNSTPINIGIGSLANALKNLTMSTRQVGINEMQTIHRKLDRSISEPVRQQIQQPPQVTTGASRYKTELCRPFQETGKCKYSDKCQFAHGSNELRSMTRHPKYKTERCRTFHSKGLCGYGSRCHFIHNEDERRTVTPPPPGLTSAPMNIGVPFVTPEEFAVGSSYGAMSPKFSDSFNLNFGTDSGRGYSSGPTSPTFGSNNSGSPTESLSPPEDSPTNLDAGFFGNYFCGKSVLETGLTEDPAHELDLLRYLSNTVNNNNNYLIEAPRNNDTSLANYRMNGVLQPGLSPSAGRLPIFQHLGGESSNLTSERT